MNFAFRADQRVKIKKTKDRQLLGPRWGTWYRTKKILEYEGNSDTNYNWCAWNCPQSIGKGTGRSGNQKKNRDHQDYSIVEIDQNTESLRSMETCCHLDSGERPPASAAVKKLQIIIIIIMSWPILIMHRE